MPTTVAREGLAPWAYSALTHMFLSKNDMYGLGKSFALTTLSEVGDKTFLVSAILAMRHSPVAVFWGCWVAMIIMSTLSSFMGAILPFLLTRRTAHWISALLFVGFGCMALYQGFTMEGDEINREWKETQEEIQEDEEEHEMQDWRSPSSASESGPYPPPPVTESRSPTEEAGVYLYVRDGLRNLCGLLFTPAFSQALTLSFLGEWGDRSQITTMILASTHRMSIVAIGTSLAHMVCILMAVTAGAFFASRIEVRHLTIAGAIIFLLFGVHAAYDAMYHPDPIPSMPRERHLQM